MAQIWDPVIVTWRDAYSPSNRRSKDLIKHKVETCIRRSVGFLLREDDDNVVICMEDDREAQEAIDSDEDCENVTIIPRGMVVKLDEMTIRRAPRRAGEPDES